MKCVDRNVYVKYVREFCKCINIKYDLCALFMRFIFVRLYFPLCVQIIVANVWFAMQYLNIYTRRITHSVEHYKISEVMKDFKKNKISVCVCARVGKPEKLGD